MSRIVLYSTDGDEREVTRGSSEFRELSKLGWSAVKKEPVKKPAKKKA
jgi:hypothetical protein|tara:strand:- start:1074 stop:1217 length:144 start_codon:yes stop_codon:yes gene_type:complete